MGRQAKRAAYDPVRAGARCAECPLNQQSPVPPEGPADADLVVVGETPGFQDVKVGRPFIGPPGNKLNEILTAVGYHRSRVFLTNAILCRPEIPHETGSKRYDFKRYLAWLRKVNAANRKAWSARYGPEIKQIVKWLRQVGKNPEMAPPEWIANAAARLEALKFKETPTPLECCAPRMWRELKHFEEVAIDRHRLYGDRPNGAVVIPVGNFAAFAVTGRKSIMKLRGSPIPVSLADK